MKQNYKAQWLWHYERVKFKDNGSTQEETSKQAHWLTLEKSVMHTENYKDFTKKAPVRQMKSKRLGSK